MRNLKDKTVVITGASRGIGAATAREFARAGAKVVLSARSEMAIEEIAEEITREGGIALATPCDVADFDAVDALMNSTYELLGPPDILINNAGILEPVERLEDSNPADWARLIDVNINGVYNGIRTALPMMKANGGGTIITVGSGAATSALEGWSHYCTSKAAVHHLNACLHAEESANGIRAMIMSPGTVATDMQVIIRNSGVNPVSQMVWEDHIPPEWAAKVFLWMCGAKADDYLGGVVALRGEELRKTIGV